MGAAVRTPNLRWLHTFSAGTDHPIFTSLARPWCARHHVVGCVGRADRPHDDAVPPGAQPRPAAACCATRPSTAGRTVPSTTSTARPSAWSAWVRSGSRSSAWPAAIGMRPIGMRRAVLGDEPCETWTIDRVAELAAAVDVLVLALPLTDDTRGIVSAAVLDGMRPGAYVVNVGRGELVDEAALVRALASGHLGGAGLDVFAVEPLPADSPLWDLPNVIVTPAQLGATRRRRGTVRSRSSSPTSPATCAASRSSTSADRRPVLRDRPDPVDPGGQNGMMLAVRQALATVACHRHPPGIHSAPRGPLPGRSPVSVTVCWAVEGRQRHHRRHRHPRPVLPHRLPARRPRRRAPRRARRCPSRPARASPTGWRPTRRRARSTTWPSSSTARPG